MWAESSVIWCSRTSRDEEGTGDVAASHYFGEYQIGDVYARSWVTIGTSAGILTA